MPVTWRWVKRVVPVENIIDASDTIRVCSRLLTMDFTSRWVDARRYLGWAFDAMQRGGEDGWDSAAGWAKRAVCRQMDGLLVQSHLRCFLGKNYKDKAEYLAKLKVPGLSVLRNLVIDPRNDIEHEYELAGSDQARQAYEIADLFLGATDKQASRRAVVTLGWNMNYRHEACSTPGKEYERIQYDLTKEHDPMLLFDYSEDEPQAMVIHPKDEEVMVAPLKQFTVDQLIALNDKMAGPLRAGNYSSTGVDANRVGLIKLQLGMM